jgi:hypothetical protein
MVEKLQISSNAEELIAKYRRLPVVVRGCIRRGLAGALLRTEDYVRRGTRVTWRRGAGGLSGRLSSFAREGGRYGIDAAIGFRKTAGFPYELAQEFGAKAKPGKAMVIPLTPEAKRSSGPRSMQGLFVLRTVGGTAFLARSQGKRKAKLVMHWLLVKRIPTMGKAPPLEFRKMVRENVPEIEKGIIGGAREGLAQVRASK